MNSKTKAVSYTTQNTYTTLNALNSATKNVWVVFHGIGYLSRYFLKYFNELNTDENYIIAPQAPSKYYLNDTYRHVGASWLTKEDTNQETGNVIQYVDAVLYAEAIPEHCKIIVFGFSQGVSIATRWLAQKKLNCGKLILYAGGLPKELTPEDFEYLITNKTEVSVIIGTNDAYLTPERLLEEEEKAKHLFKGTAKVIRFEGGHEVKKDIINSLV
jgi:predicted esterase|tara:strand:+ start:392 stop:1036 length:645 start_codon:yes stop_codon:yes gene_type:complete